MLWTRMVRFVDWHRHGKGDRGAIRAHEELVVTTVSGGDDGVQGVEQIAVEFNDRDGLEDHSSDAGTEGEKTHLRKHFHLSNCSGSSWRSGAQAPYRSRLGWSAGAFRQVLSSHTGSSLLYLVWELRSHPFYLIKSLCNCTSAAPMSSVPSVKRSTMWQEPSLSMPHATTAVRKILARVGCGRSEVVPHWPHALQRLLTDSIPRRVRGVIFRNAMAEIQRDGLNTQDKKKAWWRYLFIIKISVLYSFNSSKVSIYVVIDKVLRECNT